MSTPVSGRTYRALKLAVLVPLARLRFLFVLGAIGVLIVKWDDLVAGYDKYVRPAASADAHDPNHEYFCPMHPTVVRDSKKDKCPICFMPLSKRKKGEPSDVALPAGTVARVQLSPYRIALAGVRTAPVEYHALTREINTVGTVEFDERKLKAVAARVKGRIDTLRVNQTGQMVHAGDPLAELYSPDLVVTVQNLLDARQSANKVQETLARDRLKLWGIDDAQVEEIAKAGKPITHLTIRSPIDGHVLKKYVREGQYVEEGGPLFDVADLSTVWVQAQLYEDDLAFLPAGGHDPKTGKPDFALEASAATRAFPGRPFAGTLSFLFPHVDAETRTLTVRFDVPNAKHELRPGMTATVTLKLGYDLLAKTPAGARTSDPRRQDACRRGSERDRHRRAKGRVPPVAAGHVRRHRGGTRREAPRRRRDRLLPSALRSRGGRPRRYRRLVSDRRRDAAEPGARLDLHRRQFRRQGWHGDAAHHARRQGRESGGRAALLPPAGKIAEAQVWCPVQRDRLGVMGKPVKVSAGSGGPLYVCCEACRAEAEANPPEMFDRVAEMKQTRTVAAPPEPAAPVTTAPAAAKLPLSAERLAKTLAGLGKLTDDDRKRAVAQAPLPGAGQAARPHG